MFEGIKHSFSSDGMTGASYTDGEVAGYVSFMTEPDRTGVMSAVGPEEAVRECSLSHWVGFRGRYRAAAREHVELYAGKHW